MTIEQRKQHDDLILGETNVKELTRVIGKTENGKLSVIYNRSKRAYRFDLDGIDVTTPKLMDALPGILQSFHAN